MNILTHKLRELVDTQIKYPLTSNGFYDPLYTEIHLLLHTKIMIQLSHPLATQLEDDILKHL